MANKQQLSAKQAILLKAYAEGKTQGEAAMIAFPDTKLMQTASVIGNQVVQKARDMFPDLMEETIPDRNLLGAISEGLQAKRGTPRGEEADHYNRLKAAEIGFKLKGRFPKDSETNFNLSFSVTRGDQALPDIQVESNEEV